jgi:hypothetical protein
MVLGFVELRMANNRRDRAGANVAISEQLISNALVKDHAAALGVRNFSIPVRMPEVLILQCDILESAPMRHIDGCETRSLRYASAPIRVDERRKPASQEVSNEKTLFSSGAPRAVRGKVQKGERLLPRSRRAKAGEEAG